MGDSTAAGIGGPPLPDATSQDQACQRSTIAFAETFARVNEWNVENLGCGGATIADGILGPQVVGGLEVPPQLAVAKRAVDAETVIINIGANDLHWSSLVFLCAAADSCDNRALTAYFQHSLDRFTQDYYELLRQLTALPGDPLILINQYYEPFDPALDCLASDGLTREKIDVLLARLDTREPGLGQRRRDVRLSIGPAGLHRTRTLYRPVLRAGRRRPGPAAPQRTGTPGDRTRR